MNKQPEEVELGEMSCILPEFSWIYPQADLHVLKTDLLRISDEGPREWYCTCRRTSVREVTILRFALSDTI